MSENKKKILIIDDDVEFAESNKDLLEAHGYEVITAPDGAAGVLLAIEEKPDLFILDVMMAHDTEGFDASRKIAETPELKGTPILMVTGIRKELDVTYSFEPDDTWLPVEKMLEKPVPPELLLGEVREALGG